MTEPRDAVTIAAVHAAEKCAQSARAICERHFMNEGAAACADSNNPYKPGSAAATWWQRGHDGAIAKAKDTGSAE